MRDIIVQFGEPLATLIVGILGAVMTRFVWGRISADWARRLLQRVYAEVIDAVVLVWQTYVNELKEKSADGKLTDAERAEAKRRAVATVLKNLGDTGIQRLAKVLGFTDGGSTSAVSKTVDWLEEKTEAAVANLKSSGVIANGVKKGTYAIPAPVPVVNVGPS
jgi:uncharacterized membrane protein YeaQ/YmgE (transglycosylase-associated protein family)